MPHIIELPEELFVEVLKHIRKSDIAALNLTCSSMRRRTTSALYEDITFDWKDEEANPPPVGLLLRSVINNPQLIPRIRALGVRGRKPYESWGPTEHPERFLAQGSPRSAWTPSAPRSFNFAAQEKKKALDLMAPIVAFAGRDWQINFEAGEIDVFIAMLIIKCIKLERLHIDKDYFQSNLIDKALYDVNETHLDLKSIKLSSDLMTTEDAYFALCPFASIWSLLKLRSLRFMSASLPHDFLPEPGIETSSPLKTLELHHTRLRENELGALLETTPRLTSLKYHALYDFDHGPSEGSFTNSLDCGLLRESLQHVRHSLEDLSISIRFYTFNGDISHMGIQPIYGQLSLAEFSKLRSLEIPYVLLLTWHPAGGEGLSLRDQLPQSLIRLTLTDDSCAMDESNWSAELLAHQVELILPMLRDQKEPSPQPSITLRLAYEAAKWTAKQQQDLISTGQSAGVTCSFDFSKNDWYSTPRSTRQHSIRGRSSGPGRRGARGRGHGE